MKKKIVLIICTAIIIPIITFAHSGRTDSAGGHYDSSTGEYHYHHGYPAHQHNPDGSCPYETSSKLNVNEILDTYHDNQISNLENQISIYKAQVQLKQNTIEGLSKEIATNYQSTENLKFVIFLLTSVTIILCYIIHILNKNLKEKEYKLQQIK